ncbi:MAG: hypothetical protein K5629_04435 [Eubacteriales bacterium]|nr:hypothetical protein [Eubacteriales bacterium]
MKGLAELTEEMEHEYIGTVNVFTTVDFLELVQLDGVSSYYGEYYGQYHDGDQLTDERVVLNEEDIASHLGDYPYVVWFGDIVPVEEGGDYNYEMEE